MAQAPPETPAQEEAASLPPPKKSKKLLLILGAVLILALGGGVIFLYLWDGPAEAARQGSKPQEEHLKRSLLPLEPFLVNLADRDTRRYLRLKVELEVDGEDGAEHLKKSLAALRDSLILLLSSKTYENLSTLEGKLQLKKETVAALQALPGGKKVSGVYFTEFVAQ